MTSTTSISTLATEVHEQFETRTRDSGESFVTLKEGAPEWMRDLAMEAHGDFLPEDWRYEAIRAAVAHIGDTDAETEDDLSDESHEFADGNVDVYNADRFRWLASNLNRAGYVDEAVEELGHSGQGITGDIGYGQYAELQEVFAIVVQSLQARLDELADELETAE